jgi:Polysaccharide lyase
VRGVPTFQLRIAVMSAAAVVATGSCADWPGGSATKPPGEPVPTSDWVATFESDGASAIDGDDVTTFSSGTTGFGQVLKLGWNHLTDSAVTTPNGAKYRRAGTNGAPVVRKRDGRLQRLLGEIDIRAGQGTDSDDNAARIELGLSSESRPELTPNYGDTVCYGGAFYLDPTNFAFEDNEGQSVVLAQLPKGGFNGVDGGSPYLTFSNANEDNLHLRANWNGGDEPVNVWSADRTWAQLRGHLIRWVVRAYYHELDGTVELWWALDRDDLVKQTLAGGGKVWTGPTMDSREGHHYARVRIGHYADSVYLTPGGRHRLWWTGIEMNVGADCDPFAVEPPKLER